MEWKYELPLSRMWGFERNYSYEFFLHYPVYGHRTTTIQEEVNRFQKWLENLLDNIEAEAKEKGLKRTSAHTDKPEHFEWLAMYQCVPLSLNQIAEKVNQHRKTVEGGIKTATSLCLLKLRKPLQAGRKRK